MRPTIGQTTVAVLRWVLLLGFFAVTCALTVVLHWSTLPATPFYLVVLLGIVLGTERQGYVLTALSVSASLILPVLLPRTAPLSQTSLDTALLLLVAVTLLVAMHQRRAATRLTKAVVYETGVIRAIGNYALTRLSRDDMMQAIVRYLANSTDASLAAVVMPEPADRRLVGYVDEFNGNHGPRPIERSLAHSIAGQAFHSGKPQIVPDTSKDPDYSPVPSLPIKSLICVPLLLAGQSIGVLAVGKDQPQGFCADDVQLLETLARTLAVPLYASRPARADRETAQAGG